MSISGTKLGFLEKSETGIYILNKDWSNHPLRAPEEWPQSLCTAISMCQYAPVPQLILWGEELFQFFNDRYKGSGAIGEPFKEPALLPYIREVMQTGMPATFSSYHYSPIFIENGGIGAVLCTVTREDANVYRHELLSDFIKQMSVPIFILNGDDMILTVANDALCNLWGIDQRACGKPLRDIWAHYIPQEQQESRWEKIRESIRLKSGFEMEHQVILADGAIGWTLSSVMPVLNDDGETIEWFGIASDITSHINTEKELQLAREESDQTKRLLQAVSGSTPDLVYVFNLNYEFTYANKALLDMWGLSWEESIGKRLLDNGYEPWHAEMHEREIDEVVATKKSIRGEVSFPHATMGRRIYDYIFAPVFGDDGNVVAIAGATRDISELKAAEDALKHSEEAFRSLTQSLPQLIWTANAEGYCDFFNDKWYDYTGSTPALSYGNGWAMYLHPENRAYVVNRWMDSLSTGKPVAAEFQLRAKDGTYQWFYVLGSPIRNPKNEVNRWVGTLTNIDEQKASQERLEKLVQERTGELQRSNEDLQQFAHVASHDLKEPVRKMKLFTNRLENDQESHISANGRSYIDKINAATNRMISMIEGVLGYSSMSGADVSFEPVDLKQVMEHIATDLEVVIAQKQARITFAELPVVNGAEILLYQLFYNLIFNSLKFSHPDRVPVIQISAEVVGGSLEIVLEDNGIGFAEKYAEKIFQTFTRLHAKDQYEGTGLGLALCKKIVERHRGLIEAKGEVNVGARFRILLPL